MAFSALEALQAFGAGRQLAQQDRQMRTRAQASQQAAAGDFEGGATTALAGGDYDLAGHLRQLSTQHQQQAMQEAQIIAGDAAALRRITDPAQRQTAWAARRPQLEQMGLFGQHELDNVDLSDAGLDGYISHGTAIMQALHPQRPQEPTTMERNAAFIERDYGPEARDQYMQRNVAPPPITQHNSDGTITIIPQAGVPIHRRDGSQPQQPAQPVTMTPAQLQAQAEAAIAAGADPRAVHARLQQMLGGDTRPANDPAPAFHPAPGGAGPQGPRTFP